MPRPLHLRAMEIELSDSPVADIREMASLIRRHAHTSGGEPMAKVKIDVKCKNGNTVSCEVGGILDARACVNKISDACGAAGGTATFSGTV